MKPVHALVLMAALAAPSAFAADTSAPSPATGGDAYNLALSDRRAKAVFDYLSSRGVDPARVKSEGKGEADPIADNKTAEGRQENRRVMLIRTDSGM